MLSGTQASRTARAGSDIDLIIILHSSFIILRS